MTTTARKNLSKLISKSLCISGISSFTSNLAKCKTLVTDLLFFNCNGVFEQLECGSAAEGTLSSSSDTDIMVIVPGVLVTPNADAKFDRTKNTHIFYMDITKSNPGYTRLRLQDVHGKNLFLEGNGADFSSFLVESDEGLLLSSEKFADFFVSIPRKQYTFRHGPCTSTKCVDIHGFIDGRPGARIELDQSQALECTSWPKEAQDWALRKRKHDWPSATLVKKISTLPCYVVPIGDTKSKSFSEEWRISYIRCERELMWSLGECQLQCYVIMKKLREQYFDPIASDQLSSYHLKNIIFWLSEERGYSWWHPENLIDCVLACLSMLAICVQKKELPLYFNPTVNLFGHKFECESEKQNVFKKIDDVHKNIEDYILECLPSEWDWPTYWKKCAGDINQLVELSKTALVLVDNYKKTVKLNEVLQLYRTMFNIFLKVTYLSTKPRFLLQQMRILEKEPPIGVEPTIIELTKDYLDFRFGIAYFKQTALHEDPEFETYIKSVSHTTYDVIELISDIGHIDAMSGKLLVATVYSYLGNNDKSLELISALLEQDKYLIYPGWGSRFVGIQLNKSGVIKHHTHMNDQGPEGRTHAAYDVLFSYKDTFCVPYPVKFECALAEFDSNDDNFVVIHPSVYAYFLLFWNQYRLNDYANSMTTLQKLQKAVDDTRSGTLRHRALNILAYCYVLSSNLLQAFKCYKESLEETHTHDGALPNAATYHVAIILSNAIKRRTISHL